MLCPACQVDLQMTERQGVEIDYCPKCRGIWLDRGELDKILERMTREQAPPAAATPPPPAPGHAPPAHRQPHALGHDARDPGRRDADDTRYHDERRYYEKRRKKSFFEQLFD